MAQLAQQLTAAGHPLTEEDLHLWMEVDDDLPTAAQMTPDDIVEEVQGNQATLKALLTDTGSDLEEDPEDQPKPRRTVQEAQDAMDCLKDFFYAARRYQLLP